MNKEQNLNNADTQQLNIAGVSGSTFDLMFSRIEKAFKQGSVNLCPKCNNITEVITNPYYYWKCETCGYETDYMSLPFKHTKDFVRDILSEYCH